MFPMVFFILILVGQLGLPLLAVGAILRLCEWSWEKKGGELGSTSMILVGVVLSLPIVYYMAAAIVH